MRQGLTLRARIEELLAAPPLCEARPKANAIPRTSMENLLTECERLSSKAASRARPRIRTLHHFACTGGTIISRCIAAQPNTVLLSEIDPLSRIPLARASFAPYDIIKQAQTGIRPLGDAGVEQTFLGGLQAMHHYVHARGQRLVLRDHAHSHYCTDVDPASRPALRDILSVQFEMLGVVTVRHPVDAFLSLQKNNWITFSPKTFEEYCRRNLMFLAHHEGLPIIRYEDFVLAPDDYVRRMTEMLDLPYSAGWRELLPIITLSGDSGRTGVKIESRKRRFLPEQLATECKDSAAYYELCDRLHYQSDID